MKTILVIEDNAEMRGNIAEILELAPYAVVQADDGKTGVALARQHQPDLILCDIMMPELDGYGVLHIVGNDPALAATPFLFLTAKADPTDFRFGMNLGADDYLTKPFDDLTLLNAVELRLRKGERTLPGTTNRAGLENLIRVILNQGNTLQSLRENYPMATFAKRQPLFVTGSLPTALYFVEQGKVKIFRTDPSGNEYITSLRGSNDFVGYVALLEEGAYTETAESLEDNTRVYTIPKADFLELIYHHQGVAQAFIQLLTGAVIDHEEQLLKLAYQSVRKRVSEALLLFYRKFYAPTGGVSAVSPPNTSTAMTLSRDNWSHMAGASTETVIRILSDFRAEGLIGINASQITLLDINKLARLRQ